ncbi:hypothetical protein UFOVP736_52 [uncultured Caudovirales phage]|uniref:Uncharacterized protein n=1 Tax=uncultured Caudovirales phage TaxID=2100421 RepID=A0A6J5NIT2_9CAUD|nr:hypothetical protein UFOVP705_29 [uncultured Caudovirales phage]CAB5224303.1 hypothetical protein UFOVP736_52 [uncultured Caudovirales phage]
MKEPQNNINSLDELNRILALLFAANGINIHDVISTEETLYLDPRNVPESEWIDHSSIPIPANVAQYIDTHDSITVEETNAIEIALEKFFAITEGWYIALSSACMSFDYSGDEPKPVIKKPLQFLLLKEAQ